MFGEQKHCRCAHSFVTFFRLVSIENSCFQMRNITHRDFFHKSKKRSNVPRYFRATIIDIDHENPDFMYRVLFWDDVPNIDSVPADQWPDQGEGRLFWGALSLYVCMGEGRVKYNKRSTKCFFLVPSFVFRCSIFPQSKSGRMKFGANV